MYSSNSSNCGGMSASGNFVLRAQPHNVDAPAAVAAGQVAGLGRVLGLAFDRIGHRPATRQRSAYEIDQARTLGAEFLVPLRRPVTAVVARSRCHPGL